MLIVVEGPDGVGKTTLATALADKIGGLYYAFPGKEPDTLGSYIYELHHRKISTSPISLQMLHVAAHIDAVERVILPNLKAGADVVLDRYHWSTYVYGLAYGVNPYHILKLVEFEQMFWRFCAPRVLYLVDRSEPFSMKAVDDVEAYNHWYTIKSLYASQLYSYDQSVWHRFVITNDEGSPQNAVDIMTAQITMLKEVP